MSRARIRGSRARWGLRAATSAAGPTKYVSPAWFTCPRPVHVHRSAHLQAVFAPRARVVADPDIEALFAWCRIEQVDAVVFDASRGNDFKTLKRECLGYIRRELH